METPNRSKTIATLWKALSILGICGLVIWSGLFSAEFAQASTSIEKRCLQNYSHIKGKEKRKRICGCVASNLESLLSAERLKEMEKIYESRGSRAAASKDERLKALVEMDFDVNTKCLRNPLWQAPAEDLGKPDPLKSDVL
jgi:hypothetical protein